LTREEKAYDSAIYYVVNRIEVIIMSHQANSLKSIFYALAANFAIAIAKLVAAIITHSGSMMAESIHSFADCSNQGLLLLGIKKAKRPPDQNHPFGYGKSIYFWSFIVAIMLFSMGGLFSIYEGTHKLQEPTEMKAPLLAVGVLIFSIIVEGLSLLGCINEVNKVREGRSFITWFKQTRQSELLVIFGEDLAALIGLSLALIAVILTMITGNPVYDACGSIAIGVLLLIVAVLIGIEIKALLIGQGVEPNTKAKMLDFLNQRSEIEKVFNLLSLQLGDDVMVAIKAKMQPQESDIALIDAINDCEKAFKAEFDKVVWCFFEPDHSD
jgi:cation diffusion facilitator family transporter